MVEGGAHRVPGNTSGPGISAVVTLISVAMAGHTEPDAKLY